MSAHASGSRLGPYELSVRLKSGANGEVWKARDTRSGRTVTVRYGRFAGAMLQAGFEHPNVAAVYDAGEDYVASEYVEGAPLAPPDDTRKLLDLAVQIADGLAAAHAAGLVHGALTRDCILVTAAGRVKIVDFGAGEAADARGDQYAFGAILYEMAAGTRPAEEPEPLPASVPAPLRWTIERLLEPDPADRYETTRDLFLEIRKMRERMSGVGAAGAAQVAHRRRASFVLPLLAPGLVVAAIVLAVWANQQWRPDPGRYRFAALAAEDYPEWGAAWSRDGRRIAYAARTANDYRILVKEPGGGGPTVLVRHAGRGPGTDAVLGSLSWEAGSKRLYYVFGQRPWSVATDGAPPRELDFGPAIATHAIAASPDGFALAVLRDTQSGGRTIRRLWISSPPGAPPEMLPFEMDTTGRRPGPVSWSPDSSRLLVTEAIAGKRRLVLVLRDGTSRVLMERAGLESLEHAWMPDGRHALVSAAPADLEIRLVDTTTGGVLPVSASPSRVSWIAVSPDGARVAYTEGLARLALVELSTVGAPPRPFLASRADRSEPDWSPSGKDMAYVEGEEIRVRNPDGTSHRAVVSRRDFPGHEGALHFSRPAYSPDGKSLAYVVEQVHGVAGGIWISPAGGGAPRRSKEMAGMGPAWTADGALIFAPPSGGLFRQGVGGSDAAVQIRSGLCDPLAAGGEFVLCAANGEMSLIPLKAGHDARGLTGRFEAATLSRDGRRIYALRAGDPQELIRIETATMRSEVVAMLPEPIEIASPRLALSPDEKSVVATVCASGGDIWTLEGFEGPRGFWSRFRR